MDSINNIIKKAQNDIFPELEAKIRLELEKKDKDWLIDQIIFLTCERHSLHEQKSNFENIKKRLTRIKNIGYNSKTLSDFIGKYQKINRSNLEESGLLLNPPKMGLNSIAVQQRSIKGETLLKKVEDMLYVSLYGDITINVDLKRNQKEILTIMLPKSKSDSLSFLKAVTEMNVTGTWNDPDGVSNDDHTNNVELQIEFNNDEEGTIGLAIFTALNLINLLHVNEQILYTRMEKIERSSLS
ncbi:hypothetical protein SAMN04487765_2532 [Tenacibaculum sp. MAR_2010_89]|uniref:hypothetical protein n=1 Tax=Tenacibaculum sp. MAR_2010_89 TaxID=1250198 RepID=UPI000896C9BF|nr:hypothetical protein [Tenacibaculum sp. MAR_2010_89]SEE42794.1 hypothetical protein SAMN04487765_2532 [Tenacibaculum sp. MAR_2010_89]